MFLRKQSQTATEYLIILAVIIIIALLAISLIGGNPAINGNIGAKTASAFLQSQDVGVIEYVVGTNHTALLLRNNKNSLIRVNDITVQNITCQVNKMIKPGETYPVICGYYVDEVNQIYEVPYSINWTETNLNANFNLNKTSLTLEGTSIENRQQFMWFDGVNDYISIPSNFNWGGDDFFIEVRLFVNSTSMGAHGMHILSNNPGSTGESLYFHTVFPDYALKISSGGWTPGVTGSTSVPLGITAIRNSFTTIRVEFVNTTNTFYYYKDGILIENESITSSSNFPTTISRIGRSYTSGSEFTGIIDYININGQSLYNGHGNKNSDWKDLIGSNDGTVSGNPTTVYMRTT